MKINTQLKIWLLVLLAIIPFAAARAQAQVTVSRSSTKTHDPYQTLESQLIFRLRATTAEQRSYIEYVLKQVKEGKLDIKLVIATQRYSQQRRPDYPFPFFERAMRIQAAKYGVELPPARSLATTAVLRRD